VTALAGGFSLKPRNKPSICPPPPKITTRRTKDAGVLRFSDHIPGYDRQIHLVCFFCSCLGLLPMGWVGSSTSGLCTRDSVIAASGRMEEMPEYGCWTATDVSWSLPLHGNFRNCGTPYRVAFSRLRYPGTLCSVVGRFSKVSGESSLKVAELLAYLPWSKLKLYRK
jgi:hypothetical protein